MLAVPLWTGDTSEINQNCSQSYARADERVVCGMGIAVPTDYNCPAYMPHPGGSLVYTMAVGWYAAHQTLSLSKSATPVIQQLW